jgi:hypothetical protein
VADLAALQRDPDFLKLSPQEQQQLLAAMQPARVPDLPGLQQDPDFQALPGPQQQQVWEQVQQGVPPGQRSINPYTPPGVPSIAEESAEEGITKPSTMIPMLMGGAGVKAVQATVPKAWQWLTRPVAEGLSQTAGWFTGRTAETGQVPSARETLTEAALTTATGGLLEVPAAARQALRWSKGGQAILGADEATTAAKTAYETARMEAEALSQAANKEVYDLALRKARAAQAKYQQQLTHRQEVIAAQRETYDDAVRSTQESQYQTAREGVLAEQQAGATRQQQYQQGVSGQQQALTQARAIPGAYTPDTPSSVLYEKFSDAARDATVDLAPARAALAEVRASRGVLPDGTVRPLPQAVESIAANLERATGETSIQTIRDELRRLGPLTRSSDSTVRGAAKQLYGIYADVLEASPVANDLLRQANATFRREMAVQDLSEWLRPGHGVVRIDQQGRETINVGALLTRLDKQVGDDALFRGSFAPDELQRLRQDFGGLAGTPTMPRGGPPAAPTPVHLPGAMPDLPSGLQQPPREPAMPQPPRLEALPGAAGAGRVVPMLGEVPDAVTPRALIGERPAFRPVGSLGELGGLEYAATQVGIPPGVITAVKTGTAAIGQGRHALAYAVTSERLRPLVLAALKPDGTLDPRVYGLIVAALTPAEKQALGQDTPPPREGVQSWFAPGGVARSTD